MRLTSLTFASVFLIASLGCRTRPNSVAVGSAPTEATSVGPVPGGVVVGYQRMNPYRNDPVALQDGYQAFQLVQLLRLPWRTRRRRHGPQLARQCLALWQQG